MSIPSMEEDILGGLTQGNELQLWALKDDKRWSFLCWAHYVGGLDDPSILGSDGLSIDKGLVDGARG